MTPHYGLVPGADTPPPPGPVKTPLIITPTKANLTSLRQVGLNEFSTLPMHAFHVYVFSI